MIGDPTELLTVLEEVSAKHRLKIANKGWNWRKGIEIFIAPESRCSFCNEIFTSNRVFILDTKYNRVPKQWRIATGEQVPQGNKMYHPHAFHQNGGVCMNAAKGMAQLIFNSVSTRKDYESERYFWDIGHNCPKYTSRKCIGCDRKVPAFALVYPALNKIVCSVECSHIVLTTRCHSCYKKLRGKAKPPYCKKCTPEMVEVPVI